MDNGKVEVMRNLSPTIERHDISKFMHELDNEAIKKVIRKASLVGGDLSCILFSHITDRSDVRIDVIKKALEGINNELASACEIGRVDSARIILTSCDIDLDEDDTKEYFFINYKYYVEVTKKRCICKNR